MQLKICDFGLAIDLREERAVTRAGEEGRPVSSLRCSCALYPSDSSAVFLTFFMLRAFPGTLEYMAPEVLDCPFKNKPEENKDKTELYYSLTVDAWAMGVLTYELLVGFPPFNDKQRAAIEEKIRSEQPRFPSSMSENARSFVLRALQKNPLERPTAMELLNHPWIRAHRRPPPAVGAAAARGVAGGPSSPKPAVIRPTPLADVTGDDGDTGSSVGSSPVSIDKLASKASVEMRTDDGDLIKAMPSYLSFTSGSNRPKLPMMQRDKVVKQGAPLASSGSFSTANNPKMQNLRGLS